jgi:hypothetical protein
MNACAALRYPGAIMSWQLAAISPAGSRACARHSQASLRTLAKRYGINKKTVAKLKKRNSVADVLTSPKQAKSTVLFVEEEAVIVALRRYTLLPLDDYLYCTAADYLGRLEPDRYRARP